MNHVAISNQETTKNPKMVHLGHIVIKNRNGLIVKTNLADGCGERETAINILAELPGEHQKLLD